MRVGECSAMIVSLVVVSLTQHQDSLDTSGCCRWPEPFAGVLSTCSGAVADEAVDREGSSWIIREHLQQYPLFGGGLPSTPV